MKQLYIYPGTFCPPHYGHIALAKEAAQIFGEVIVICSENPVKLEKNIFTMKECKKLWESYDLGKNIKVTTLPDFLALWKKEPVVVIRGIRNENDIKFENDVMVYQNKHYGNRFYHYIICEDKFKEMSSTRVRQVAQAGDSEALNGMVNGEVAREAVGRYKKDRFKI